MLDTSKPVRLNHEGGAPVDILLVTDKHILGIVNGKFTPDVWDKDGTSMKRTQFDSLVNVEEVTTVPAVALPSTPQQVIDFIGGRFESLDGDLMHDDLQDIKYILCVHDLLSAFENLQTRSEV